APPGRGGPHPRRPGRAEDDAEHRQRPRRADGRRTRADLADRHDRRLPGALRRLDVDGLADALAEQRRAERGGGRRRAVPAEAGDLDLHPAAGLVLDRDPRADRDHARNASLDYLGVLEPGAEDRDLALEQALLVLRGVVLEVLGEVAVTAGGRDRLDDLLAPRPLELRQLGLEPGVLVLRQMLSHSPERS